jgi:hypothetical protein
VRSLYLEIITNQDARGRRIMKHTPLYMETLAYLRELLGLEKRILVEFGEEQLVLYFGV